MSTDNMIGDKLTTKRTVRSSWTHSFIKVLANNLACQIGLSISLFPSARTKKERNGFIGIILGTQGDSGD